MWSPPPNWQSFTTVDVHTEGEPLRIVTGGINVVPGDNMVAKREFARQHLDWLRRRLMFEPRGHADMYGAIVTEPVTPGSDFGVLFMHNEGWSTMCGHGIIALVTALYEMSAGDDGQPMADSIWSSLCRRIADRLKQLPIAVHIDTPAGRVTASADIQNRRVRRVQFENVPSFVFARDQVVKVAGLGEIEYDVTFGGAFYAYVDADRLGLTLDAAHARQLIDVGMTIKRAVMAALPIVHPFEPALGFLYGTILGGSAHDGSHQSRNVCVFAEGEVDRSPTGTGVSGRLAIEHARGRLKIGRPFVVESILGTPFTGTIVAQTKFGEYPAITPAISGRAWITGRHEFLIAPDDVLRDGFLLR